MITRRRIHINRGSEGPRHDPYGYDELIISETVDDIERIITIHMGLLLYITVNDKTWRPDAIDDDAREKQLDAKAEELLGCRLEPIYTYAVNEECKTVWTDDNGIEYTAWEMSAMMGGEK